MLEARNMRLHVQPVPVYRIRGKWSRVEDQDMQFNAQEEPFQIEEWNLIS